METTKVVYLLDSSGSMASYKRSVMNALDEYFAGLSEDGQAYEVSLYQFSNRWRPRVKTVCTSVPVKAVPKAESFFDPNGGTPLFQSIIDVCNMHKYEKDILFVIQTDGMETEHRIHIFVVRDAIANFKTELNWQFLYLGANQDAEQVGEQLGIGSGNSLTYDANDSEMMAQELRQVTTNHAKSGGAQRNDTFAPAKKKRTVNWVEADHPRGVGGKFIKKSP